jgi:hypothetical protein
MNTTFNLNRVSRLQCALASTLLVLSCAGLSAAPKATGHAAHKVTHHRRSYCNDLNGGHIFLSTGNGNYADVTNSLVTVNGQNYVTLQGNQIPVVLNLNSDLVYDLHNNMIGYIGTAPAG